MFAVFTLSLSLYRSHSNTFMYEHWITQSYLVHNIKLKEFNVRNSVASKRKSERGRLKRFDHHNTLNYVQPTIRLLKLSPHFFL